MFKFLAYLTITFYHPSLAMSRRLHDLGIFFSKDRKLLRLILYFCLRSTNMVVVAQLVRASDCGSEGRRFEPGHPPKPLE